MRTTLSGIHTQSECGYTLLSKYDQRCKRVELAFEQDGAAARKRESRKFSRIGYSLSSADSRVIDCSAF